MIDLRKIQGLLNERKNRVLLLAQASMPERQFQAFRKLFLDEFGQKGLESELALVFAEHRLSEVDEKQ